ncbi:Protein SENESCENCE-ASSOCIATED GENE 21, mitochondrial [Salvia divinorum]|uniref:Protein SENESCENCE-ASSOCIATED GENE 21, mitochondrial n=1 Tax=Salvia divinorum TaxID=28513 RepID=A0ABD1H5I2_SALDI
MARSFSNAKTVSALLSSIISRRGFAHAAASQGGVSSSLRGGAPSVMLKKGSEESAKISWVPDPKTGYYRPENHAKEIDAAELREMLVKSKTRRS